MTMNRTKVLVAGLAVFAAATVVLFGGLFERAGGTSARAAGARDNAVFARLLTGLAGRDTASYVSKLERELSTRPGNPETLLLLGFAYQQRARETGDTRFFTMSERALREAGARSTAGIVETGLAALAVARHRFGAAIPLARRAVRANSENATAYGALGDALLNLGRYREAFRAYDRMAELSPSVASYSRIAHARELLGRPTAAAEALELALTLRVPLGEHRAAALVQLGNLAFNTGHLSKARRRYEAALAAYPGYLHAMAGLARTEAAEGDFRHAVPLFRSVVKRLPLPQYVIWQADTLRAAGRRVEARRAHSLVAVVERLQAANGVRTDLQTALFDLDHGRRLRDALQRARSAHARAPSVDAEDVLAWALARNGRCDEALTYSERALRLGTLDAMKFFHRGMIERCLGHGASAGRWFRLALSTNPSFSLLWAPVAKRYAIKSPRRVGEPANGAGSPALNRNGPTHE
jgi:tetratricopeptide (TPR) repeat protein